MKIDPKCVGCIGFKICAHSISAGDDICEIFNKSVEALKPSHNICGNDVCEYCAKHGKCFGTQHFPKCFVGRKLSPVS
jgi:hypothetical protein